MKEMKFKLWDKETKFMSLPVSIYKINFGDCDTSRWLPLQFTGLLDKSGKEIYDGDVLRIESNVEETCIGVVDFVDGCFDVRFDEEGTDTEPLRDLIPSEIIGNIYENPDLLK